jgi:hypothetical protein
MSEKNLLNNDVLEIGEAEINTISSAEFIKSEAVELPEAATPQFLAKENLTEKVSEVVEEIEEPEEEIDPIFVELAEPKLPELQKENRAKLLMQSPNRLYFYWSIKNNPFQTLQKVFAGNTGNYQLVAKFVNLKTDREEMRAVDAEGNYWFNVEADSRYRAEIGFYAPGRPYIRVIFSNTIETPRKSPSPRMATDADWAISANTFAKVLDVSGFSRDAYEVALAGDSEIIAEHATNNAFYQLTGERKLDFSSEEVRFALLALASGVSLEELRGQISEALFSILQENIAKLSAENALAALKENFEVFDEEIFEQEEIGAAVFGVSLVNFPKTIKKRTVSKLLSPKDAPKFIPKLSPISSFSVRESYR